MNEKHEQTAWYETLTVKLIILGFMTLALLIPLQLIQMIIREREASSNDVVTSISDQWGRQQTITGPVLNLPVYRVVELKEGKSNIERDTWHILPEKLDISGKIDPQIRYRGIYEAVIYDSNLEISGSFILPDGRHDNYQVAWEEAYFTMGISDNRGLRDTVVMNAGGRIIDAIPGVYDQQLFLSGITFPANFAAPGESFPFRIDLGLRGSGGIYFSPAGKTTTVKIESGWKAPSFAGSFLPDNRQIDETGFSSEWVVTHLNRNFPQQWTGEYEGFSSDTFGVDLILEVDHYLKSERSAKYGILFIALTFMVLLYLELTSSGKIHVFSYFLVGLALVLFFSLLNSLSEHTGFSLAYTISSVATISLVTLFTKSQVEGAKTVIVVGGMLTILYAFIFVLLALKDYAYLAGNIGLFVALGAIMYISARTKAFKNSTL
ncbi:MAG: cell envelope integrity protein CreD [Bacteroidales bacterium]